MRQFAAFLCVWVVASGARLLPPLAAQEKESACAHHPWARFDVGAWKRVRVTKESFDKSGRLTAVSTRDTTSTLVEVDQTSYTLRIDVVVEVAGKRFAAQPQFMKQGFYGETAGQTVSVEKTGEGDVTIDGAKIPCQLERIVIQGSDQSKQITTVHYADSVFPYVLKRETQIADAAGAATGGSVSAEVLSVDMPYKVLAETKPVAYVKIVRRLPRGDSVTLEVQCADVPGGVVAHSSKQRDEQGRVISRSTLELVEYGLAGGPATRRFFLRPRLFPRLRSQPN